MAEPDQFERPVAAEARQVTRGGIIHFEPRVGEADLVAIQLDRGAFDHPAVDEQMAARDAARDVGNIDMARLVVEFPRSEERRVGKECVSTCRSRWSPYH